MKAILGIIIGAAIVVIVVALYCAMVVAGRFDENENIGDNNQGDDNMFFKKQICSRCKIGKYTYELDKHTEACQYIGCWKNGKCHYYKPLVMAPKRGLFSRLRNK